MVEVWVGAWLRDKKTSTGPGSYYLMQLPTVPRIGDQIQVPPINAYRFPCLKVNQVVIGLYGIQLLTDCELKQEEWAAMTDSIRKVSIASSQLTFGFPGVPNTDTVKPLEAQ